MCFKKSYTKKKKIQKQFFDVQKIIKFEREIFDLYNKGKIKYPIHLTKGNENQLVEIFKYVHTKDWCLHPGEIMHMHYCTESLKKLKQQIMNGKSMYISSKK